MDNTTRQKVNDFIRLFAIFNKQSWAKLRHEKIFMLIVYLEETYPKGVKVEQVTQVLKRGSKTKQTDRNETWEAGRKLIKRGYLNKYSTGYYQTTALGRNYSRSIIIELLEYGQ